MPIWPMSRLSHLVPILPPTSVDPLPSLLKARSSQHSAVVQVDPLHIAGRFPTAFSSLVLASHVKFWHLPLQHCCVVHPPVAQASSSPFFCCPASQVCWKLPHVPVAVVGVTHFRKSKIYKIRLYERNFVRRFYSLSENNGVQACQKYKL